jgi:uncharacterized FlaG/YvyC family protein
MKLREIIKEIPDDDWLESLNNLQLIIEVILGEHPKNIL